ncbi:hypothetical protein PMAYCL1PPCAC_10422, partial [Pristionchus mayeri]
DSEYPIGEHPIYKELSNKPMPKQRPLQVNFGFYIESLGNFRSTEMTFDVDMYLYMSWQDETYRHNQSDYILISDKDILDKMWLPGLYFANARTAYFHDVTVHNFNLFIAPDGTIAYGTRVTLNVACNLFLQDYPLDKQVCGIKVLSYAHVKEEMNVTWFSDGPIRFNPAINLPEFHITALESSYCDGLFHYTITKNSSRIGYNFFTGDFSCLIGMLRLQRAIGFHLVQSYIPTGLIVAISWVSFWIDRRAVPARVSLSFTTLLTLSTQGNGIRYALPPVSYAKAIDYFYGVCMLFIFGVLLEFALVNSFMRRANKYSQMAEKLRSNGYSPPPVIGEFDSDYDECKSNGNYFYGRMPKKAKNGGIAENGTLNPPKLNPAHFMYEAIRYSRRALAVDQMSRIIFPLTFSIFNAVYWLFYLNRAQEDPQYTA